MTVPAVPAASADAASSEASPDLRLVAPALAAWLAALVAWRLPIRWAAVLTAALLVSTLGTLLVRRAAGVVAAATLVCAAAAAVAVAARAAPLRSGPLADLTARRAVVTAALVLTADPEVRAGRVRFGRAAEVVVARARVERLTTAGETLGLRAPVVVVATGEAGEGWRRLLPGTRVQVQGRLSPARPGEPVAAVVSVRVRPHVTRPPPAYHRVAGRLRAGLHDAAAGLPPAAAGLLPGLVLGDTSRLDPQVRADFRATGLSHLVAVSGANVAIVLGAVLAVARAVGLRLRARAGVGALALVGFVVLARPSPSVLRAAAMGLVVLAALGTGRQRQAIPALAAAVFGLVLVTPELARSAGFALSVLATAALIVLAPPLASRLARWLPRWLAEAVAVPTAAGAATAPLVAALSGSVSLVTVPANLLVAPAVAPATVLGVVAVILAPIALPLAQLVAELAGIPVGWLVAVAGTGAGMPGAAIAWPAGATGGWLLVGLLAAGAGLLLSRRARPVRRPSAAAAVSALVVLLGARVVAPGWPPPGWWAVVCDVGQGDAIALNAGDGTAVVVDAGPDPILVDGCLRRLGVRRVPLLVLTHYHADHVLGLPGVLRRRAVGRVLAGPLGEPAEQAAWVRRELARARVPLEPAVPGTEWALGSLRWRVLGPAAAFRGTQSDPNNSSVVLRVRTRGITALLAGDMEPPAQQALRDAGEVLAADVLKVAHHGSAAQDPEFLAAVRPRVAVTSVGADNEYGHPAPALLADLRRLGALQLRTDRHGDVALAVRGGRLEAVPQRRRPAPRRAPSPRPPASPR